jgi:membrane-bound metal-dependent hydrolase YbcI (DUF457 family)
VSWAAHQFEIYAVQAHLPRKMRGQVSFWGIFLGDFTPDFLSKFWVYGITIGGTHYGSDLPHQWHRGWPGMGFTHTLFFGVLAMLGVWAWKRNRAFAIGYLFGYAAHALTDVNDSVGTMLLFPFTTANWTLETWAYAATVEGGKYLDAAAYYSSFGLVMDLFWFAVVLFSWRVFTREYWRTQVVPVDPHVWAWFGRWLPERGLLALYRATMFYGVSRLVAWTTWAHVLERPVIDGAVRRGYPMDWSWKGPWWLDARTLPHVPPVIVLPVTLGLLALVYWAAGRAWDPMGRAEAARRAARAATTGTGRG